MHPKNLNAKKGIAGLEVLLSLVASLFMIGMLVMAFVVSGTKLEDSLDENDTAAREVVNKTYTAIDDVPDWFPTFIVIGAIIVIVLLLVIFYNAIQRSGLMGGA